MTNNTQKILKLEAKKAKLSKKIKKTYQDLLFDILYSFYNYTKENPNIEILISRKLNQDITISHLNKTDNKSDKLIISFGYNEKNNLQSYLLNYKNQHFVSAVQDLFFLVSNNYNYIIGNGLFYIDYVCNSQQYSFEGKLCKKFEDFLTNKELSQIPQSNKNTPIKI